MITNNVDLIVADGQATPVNHTFNPGARVQDNVARWIETTANGGLGLGFSEITQSIRDPIANSAVPVFKIVNTVKVPKVDVSIPTAPKILATAACRIEWTFPAVMNDAERKNVVAYVRNLLAFGGANVLGDNIVAQRQPY